MLKSLYADLNPINKDTTNVILSVVSLFIGFKQEVMEWMIDTQLGRRNLTPIQRIIVVKKYEDKIKQQAKERQEEAGGDVRHKNALLQKDKSEMKIPIHTDKELAKLAKVGSGTISLFSFYYILFIYLKFFTCDYLKYFLV